MLHTSQKPSKFRSYNSQNPLPESDYLSIKPGLLCHMKRTNLQECSKVEVAETSNEVPDRLQGPPSAHKQRTKILTWALSMNIGWAKNCHSSLHLCTRAVIHALKHQRSGFRHQQLDRCETWSLHPQRKRMVEEKPCSPKTTPTYRLWDHLRKHL
jgi:hypothetical protein